MILSRGYSIEYYRNYNQIVIGLPQTEQTANSTAESVSKRKVNMTENELASILYVAMVLMEVKNDE